jgi:hypothetical protein
LARIGNSFVRLIMTYGYMLSGTASNVYVQNLCRGLVCEGHDVHLICQERELLAYDFVNECLTVAGAEIERQGEQETPYPGRCAIHRLEIGGLLPIYVCDEYPGWRVETFLDLTEEQFENYVDRNVEAARAVLEAPGAGAVVTNRSVPGPLISRRTLGDVPYLSIAYGSCLRYVARKSDKYMQVAREDLEGAKSILALSSHSAGTIVEDFPELEERTSALPGGVHTELIRPEALDLASLEGLHGGAGRGPEQDAALREAPDNARDARELAHAIRSIAGSYNARSHDRHIGERLGAFVAAEDDPPSWSTSASSSTLRASTAWCRPSPGYGGRRAPAYSWLASAPSAKASRFWSTL